ncbi:unnamed protein product [Mytilus edulis]|uniref:DZIP3-like HEPN domain-containing protein n=1 Tax=Mytilus edulis TaxID=6550 RepID=A0A8S3PZZ4_MYTED|nr:unnamed protein product [Mytilus edulis]
MSGSTVMTSCNGPLMTNYARIGHAAQQVFPDILQDIIAIKEPQHRLYSDVTSNCSSPSKGWNFHTPPAANEILPGDDIERIRRTRNEILHRGNAKVSDTNLTDYFTTFKDIAIRLEAYLGKPKGEFQQKFQNLEKCCMDEITEKTYLESLTILRERDINLSKAVENIQKDLDSLLYKESHQIVIEEWEEQNKLFIKTDAVDFVLESLKEMNCCTVIGTSGIGKSATIHHVALFLRDTEGYRIIPIHSPSEIDKYFQRNRKQIFVIDDICGKYTVIQTEVEKWIKRNDSTNRVLKHNSNENESEQERQTREDFIEDCGIPRNTLRQRILEQLKSLVPLFVRSNNDLSGQQSFLRFADNEMLNERTMLKSLVSTDEDVEEFTILIDEFNEDRYFKRIVDQWSSGKLASLLYSRQMNYETYRNKLINFLNRLPKEKCKEMMTIEIDKEVVQFNFIDDSCSGSLPVSPLSLSFKRNFSDLVKYILDFIKNTKGESFSFYL